jgi:serine acetyltransferase
MAFRAWVLQDWAANAGRPETRLLLAWFRLAQWADGRWGAAGRLLLGFELPVTATVGPRLRIYHRNGIVVSAHATLGSDCQLRHAVTIGNKTDRAGREVGVARIGDNVDLGAGCAVIGDIEVGDHARIGALAVVTRSVPAWAVVAGNPGRVIRVDRPEAADSHAQPRVTR